MILMAFYDHSLLLIITLRVCDVNQLNSHGNYN